MGTHQKLLSEALLMSTHNIYFNKEIKHNLDTCLIRNGFTFREKKNSNMAYLLPLSCGAIYREIKIGFAQARSKNSCLRYCIAPIYERYQVLGRQLLVYKSCLPLQNYRKIFQMNSFILTDINFNILR